MDIELLLILKKECECRAAAEIGEERRFFQALVNALEEAIESEGMYEHAVRLLKGL
jgi:hypothetical protein